MRKSILLVSILGLISLTFSNVGCKKEVQVQTLDSMAVVKNLLIGKWLVTNFEWEIYSGNTLVEKKVEDVVGTNTYIEYRSDQTYEAVNNGAPNGSGPWELISPYYLVFNKGDAIQERYYYIMLIDKKVLVTHGPFKNDGRLFDNTNLYSFYYTK